MAASKPNVGGKSLTSTQTVLIQRMLVDNERAVLDKRQPATYETYRRIRRQPTVALARALTIAPVVASEWSVEADDDADDTWVKFIKDQVVKHRELLIRTALEAECDYGWSPWEMVLENAEYDGSTRIVVKKFKPLLVDITDILIVAEDGEFDGFRQPPPYGKVDYAEVPLANALLVNFNVEGNNWYGQPLLENIRSTYHDWNDANAGAKRYDKKIAGSIWVVYYPPGKSKLAGVETANETIAQNILNALESSGSVAIPRRVLDDMTTLQQQNPDWDVVLKEGSPKQGSFIERMSYCDKLFVRGLLTPERAILEGNFGTRAESAVHTDAAMTNRDNTHKKVTAQVNEQAVDRLLEWNFGPEAKGTVRLVAAPLLDTKVEFFRTIYQALLANPASFQKMFEEIDADALMDTTGVPRIQEVAGMEPGDETNDQLAALVGDLYKRANADVVSAPAA